MQPRIQRVDQPTVDPRFFYLESLVSQNREISFQTADEEHIPVFAKVTDLTSWEERTDVRKGASIKFDPHTWIVTSRVARSTFKELSALHIVKSLAITTPVQLELHISRKEIGLPATTAETKANQRGKGVIIGIVDHGCDFLHTNFIKPAADNKSLRTRIHSLWVQSGPSSPNSPYRYGKEFSRSDINAALRTGSPYKALNYRPELEAHGTHVMDIAAGSGQVPGIAPEAKIVFVDLAIEKDKRLAESVCALEAVEYIFKKAGDRPCVVNLSLGQHGGAHDGTSLMEQGLDALIKSGPNRAIVIAAGNAYQSKCHSSGIVGEGKHVDITWRVKEVGNSDDSFEIWYSKGDEFIVEVYYKDQTLIQRVELNNMGPLTTAKGEMIGFVSHKQADNGDNVFQLFHDPMSDVGGGDWRIRLIGKSVTQGGKFHGWIERKHNASEFYPSDPNYTLGSISSGYQTLVVGSYDAHRSTTPISYFSSAGPTRDDRKKPDVSAPGHEVWAANATTTDQLTEMSGTSMAAPVVTGLIARLLGEATTAGKSLDIDAIRSKLIQACRKNPPTKEWDPQYGNGRVSSTMTL